MKAPLLSQLSQAQKEGAALSLGLVVLLGVVGIGTAAMAARTQEAQEAELERLVAAPGFSAAPCPEDWAEVHGRITGLGTEGMIALLQARAVLENAHSVRARLLAFRARPSAAIYRDPRAMAELQIDFCLSEAWNLSLM